MATDKRLVRSKTNKMLGGVCGGLGDYFGFDPTLIRLVFAALILFGAGSPILLYLLMWVIIPGADSPRALLGVNDESTAVQASSADVPNENVPNENVLNEKVPAASAGAQPAPAETDETVGQAG